MKIKINTYKNITTISGISGSGKTAKLLELFENEIQNTKNGVFIFQDSKSESCFKIKELLKKYNFTMTQSGGVKDNMIVIYIGEINGLMPHCDEKSSIVHLLTFITLLAEKNGNNATKVFIDYDYSGNDSILEETQDSIIVIKTIKTKG